ncbi:hypothetical protein [Microbispora amethystogenes]|uniref:Uncharacterized protein n=1 Tax=Microbispora amethystogenes TaxID=1427754 RepID=A0ABQ4F8I7_9ACTN|nr:hypothetical protein Mam01_12520 [Microbispora amethystogenes]
MIAFADLLRPDRPIDLPLIVLPRLVKDSEQHDGPSWSTPVRYPCRTIPKPDAQFPDRTFQVIRPGPAELGALLRKKAGHLVDSLEIAVTEVVEPLPDFRLDLKAVQLTHLLFR